MSKLNETNSLINRMTAELRKNPNPNADRAANTALLADIAKSLAMVADKLCEEESEDKT